MTNRRIRTKKRFFKILYDGWIKFAKAIGRVQTSVILFILYFIGIGAISVVSFVFRKDFLDKALDGRSSYWRERPSDVITAESCKRQF